MFAALCVCDYYTSSTPALYTEARGHAAEIGPGFGAGAALEEATSLAKARLLAKGSSRK